MSGCNSIQSQLTAAADGELSRWQNWLVQSHLRGCDDCRGQASRTEKDIASQTAVLKQLMSAPPIDVDALRRRVRVAIAAEPETAPRWSWQAPSLRPVMTSVAAFALALLVFTWSMGGPTTMLTTLGVVEPPKAVASKTDMFYEYMMIQKLDALENFDSVNSIPLDEGEQTSFHPTAWVS